MFESALLESARHSSGKQRTVSTAASLALQTGLLATFVLVPLLARQIVPDVVLRQPVWLRQVETPAPPVQQTGSSTGPQVFVAARVLTQPAQIRPLEHNGSVADVAPVQIHGTNGPSTTGLPGIFGSGSGPVLPDSSVAKHPPVSVLKEGVVITRVDPIYPHLAMMNRIQGAVHLNAVITPAGTLESIQVVSGPPLLVDAARDALRQWRFRPYVLNGKPIEVQTEVIFKFSLN
jgi:periplasmic protein TonB